MVLEMAAIDVAGFSGPKLYALAAGLYLLFVFSAYVLSTQLLTKKLNALWFLLGPLSLLVLALRVVRENGGGEGGKEKKNLPGYTAPSHSAHEYIEESEDINKIGLAPVDDHVLHEAGAGVGVGTTDSSNPTDAGVVLTESSATPLTNSHSENMVQYETQPLQDKSDADHQSLSEVGPGTTLAEEGPAASGLSSVEASANEHRSGENMGAHAATTTTDAVEMLSLAPQHLVDRQEVFAAPTIVPETLYDIPANPQRVRVTCVACGTKTLHGEDGRCKRCGLLSTMLADRWGLEITEQDRATINSLNSALVAVRFRVLRNLCEACGSPLAKDSSGACVICKARSHNVA